MSSNLELRPDQVHPSVFIARGAVVLGDVTIGEESSVWFNAVIRGDTEAIRIGRRSNVQDGCVLHADAGLPCTIGDGVTIGHLAIVHGAVVEDNVTIGMHSTVLNGARIGRDSVVAAGAVVLEGAVVPPGSLVAGVPAKIKRPAGPDDIERNRRAAEHYVRQSRRFMAEAIQPQ